MDYCVLGALLEAYCKLKMKKTIAEVKEVLQVIWGNLPQGPIDKAVKDSQIKRLKACVGACSWRWTLTSNIHSDNKILAVASDH